MSIRIVIPAATTYDDVKGEFHDRAERVLFLEHSLLSMSRWEAEYKQCFSTATLDPGMFRFYITCMTDESLSAEEIKVIEKLYRNRIVSYMFDERTAKKGSVSASRKASPSPPNTNIKRNQVATEDIYYVMFERGIPLACEKWHFSRLLSLIDVYSKHDPKPKKGKGPKKHASPSQYTKLADINRSRLNNK